MNYDLIVLSTTDYGKKVGGDVQKSVGDNKKITKTDDWGTKVLAYKIKKQSEAAYFLFTLALSPNEVSPLDQTLRRNENILRYLLVRQEKIKRSLTLRDKKQKNLKTEKRKTSAKKTEKEAAVKKAEKKMKTKKTKE